MPRLIVQGGNPLHGRMRINGAKNAVLPMMAAAVLTESECIIEDVPYIRDVRVMINILRNLGVRVALEEVGGKRHLSVKADQISTDTIPAELMREMRSSVLLIGPMLARLGSACMIHPGGCAIGLRPIDMHLNGFRKLNARIEERGGQIRITAGEEGLLGTDIYLEYPSVGATENAIMAATLAEGSTRIWNPAREPEIENLAEFLRLMGSRIWGTGTDVITVEGSARLGGARCTVIPDRIEAGTFAIAAAITGGEVQLENVRRSHMRAFIAKMCEVGVRVVPREDDVLWVRGPERPQAADVRTLPYPGFPTDLQNQYLAMACTSEGTSVITETIFENRFKVAEEFVRMGASIRTEGRLAVVKGVPALTGTRVKANEDLRGAASLILAGLRAEGTTEVEGAEHIDRGYMDFAGRLQKLGASISRED
ncbi:MAG: UDP-N-acetylglucosamine 1-carboxyvinyltransferase [Bacillota bacterium]